MESNGQPVLLVLSGPSGVGKTTVARRLLETNKNLKRVVTCTTRDAREGEVDGVDYYFLGKSEFLERLKSGNFLEHAVVYGKYYGTLRSSVYDSFTAGQDVLIVNDVQGALALNSILKEDVELSRALQTIILITEEVNELRKRLESRDQDNQETIEERLENASKEMGQQNKFDHVVISTTRDEDYRHVQEIYSSFKNK